MTHCTKTCRNYLQCPQTHNPYFQKNGYNILICSSCHLGYVNIPGFETEVKKVFDDDYFFGGKDGYPDYLQEKELLVDSGKQYGRILSKYCSTGRLLDVGAAAGFILNGYSQTGWTGIGIEPNDTMASYGRKNLQLDIRTDTLDSFCTNELFDAVSMIQVIGSIPELDKGMRKVNALLKPGGYVIVESWRRESWAARLFGKHWHEYCPPKVITWFTNGAIESFFISHGFQPVASGKPVKKINVNHGLSLAHESLPKIPLKTPMTKLLIRMFGKYTVKYPAFDLKWYLFQKIKEDI